MRLGYHATREQAQELLRSFTERPGWKGLKAVQEKEVYGIFHGFSFRIYNFAGIQAFAKWFYPGLFADVDPLENLRYFHSRFVPVEFSGTWMLRLE